MSWVWFALFLAFVTPASGLLINEVMYNPVGADSGNEWAEIYNNDSETYNITGWKFNTVGVDHTLNVPPANGGRGTMVVGQGEYVIIAQNATSFINAYSSYNGTVIDSAWTDLSNSANETMWIKNSSYIFHNITLLTVVSEGNTTCLINNSLSECIPTPGTLNMAATTNTTQPGNQSNATANATISCNLALEIKTNSLIYNISAIDFDLFVNDTNCNNTAHNTTISYFVEDVFGNVVKPLLNTTRELTCSSTISRQWTPDDVSGSEAYNIITNITDTGCNDTDTSNNNATKLIVVKGNISVTANASSINITSVNIGSDNEVKYGEAAAVDVEIYRGNTTKYAIDVYVQDSRGNKLSDVSTMHASSKFTSYKFSVPVQMKSNCDNSLQDGTFIVLAEGLDTNFTYNISVRGVSTSTCKTITIQTGSSGGISGSAVTSVATNQTTNKTDITVEILSYNETLNSGDEFYTKIKIENSFAISKNVTIYSYVFKGNNPVSLGYDEEKRTWLATYTANSKTLEMKPKSSTEIELKNSIEDNTSSGLYNLRTRVKYDEETRDATKGIAIIKTEPDIKEAAKQESRLNITDQENRTEENYTNQEQRITGLATEKTGDQTGISGILSPIYAFFDVIFSMISGLFD